MLPICALWRLLTIAVRYFYARLSAHLPFWILISSKIQNKEDLRNGRQLLHNHQRWKNLCFWGSIQCLPPNEAVRTHTGWKGFPQLCVEIWGLRRWRDYRWGADIRFSAAECWGACINEHYLPQAAQSYWNAAANWARNHNRHIFSRLFGTSVSQRIWYTLYDNLLQKSEDFVQTEENFGKLKKVSWKLSPNSLKKWGDKLSPLGVPWQTPGQPVISGYCNNISECTSEMKDAPELTCAGNRINRRP